MSAAAEPLPAEARARIKEGLRIRRAVLGEENVDAMIAAADDFIDMFNDATHEFCFGTIWARPALDFRTRSMLTLAITAARSQHGAVKRHVRSAVRAGYSKEQIAEIFLHAYVYAGVYACLGSFLAAKEVFAELAAEERERRARRRKAARRHKKAG